MSDKEAPTPSQQKELFCPSSHADFPNAVVFGNVDGQSSELHCSHVSYLQQPQAVESAGLSIPATASRPTEAFRFAAPCVKGECHNWSGSNCLVAERLVQVLPVVTEQLPSCKIRPICRWFQEQGKPACLRCPQVITDDEQLIAALNSPNSPLGSRALSSEIFNTVAKSVAKSVAAKGGP
jgi:hypothetical protein